MTTDNLEPEAPAWAADMMEELQAIRKDINEARNLINVAIEEAGPLIESVAKSPIMSMLGGFKK